MHGTAFSLSCLMDVEEFNATSLKSNIPENIEEITLNYVTAIVKQSYVTQAIAVVVVQVVEI